MSGPGAAQSSHWTSGAYTDIRGSGPLGAQRHSSVKLPSWSKSWLLAELPYPWPLIHWSAHTGGSRQPHGREVEVARPDFRQS